MFSLMMFSLCTLMVIISALALFTPGSGYDPEFSNYSALSIGMDTNRFPRNREAGLGFTLNL